MPDFKVSITHLEATTSTNDYLKHCPTPPPDGIVVAATDYQTAGRGQGTNTWESERGKNLLLSILTSPVTVAADRQYVLSMAGALALKAALDTYTDGISLKWPNDIYWHDNKLSGTLIETCLKGKTISRCVFGIGLNVNQHVFRSSAPNPISLSNILGHDVALNELLDHMMMEFTRMYALATSGSHEAIHAAYNAALYRREGLHPYEDCATGELFRASLNRVDINGRLHLVDTQGCERAYWMKEVRFCLGNSNECR